MKKIYNTPAVELQALSVLDVITASGVTEEMLKADPIVYDDIAAYIE